MPRFFLEVSYKGTNYSGFQVQLNAVTVQSEVETAISTLLRRKHILTGSSRTDAGVHARQNFFHFDSDCFDDSLKSSLPKDQFLYKMNAILPYDIVVNGLYKVPSDANCRFDAISREYHYFIYQHKNPFLSDRAYYFPYKLDIDLMQQAAGIILEYNDFTSFSKRKTQVKNNICSIGESKWSNEEGLISYKVVGNRFLRGMVRALVATMLKIGRRKISANQFREIIESKNGNLASFAAPSHGLFLQNVNYPENYFKKYNL